MMLMLQQKVAADLNVYQSELLNNKSLQGYFKPLQYHAHSEKHILLNLRAAI